MSELWLDEFLGRSSEKNIEKHIKRKTLAIRFGDMRSSDVELSEGSSHGARLEDEEMKSESSVNAGVTNVESPDSCKSVRNQEAVRHLPPVLPLACMQASE